MAKTAGCALSGFVLVKKVPGALHFLAKSPGHSFDYRAMNMSHVVSYLYFGNKPSPRRHQARCLALCPDPTKMLLEASDACPPGHTWSPAWHPATNVTKTPPGAPDPSATHP